MVEVATRRAETTRGQWILRKVVFPLLVVLAFVLLMIPIVRIFGGVTGEEFSPQTFKRRSFTYYELPFVKIQITPVYYIDESYPLRSHLRAKQHLSTKEPPRWDLVLSIRPDGDPHWGDASILTDYLDRSDDGNSAWLKWSRDHPELAALFWPEVSSLARRGLYFFVPELFALARGAKDARTFAKDLHELLAEKHHQLAIIQQRRNQHESAVRLFDEALRHQPNRAASVQGRAESMEAIRRLETAQHETETH